MANSFWNWLDLAKATSPDGYRCRARLSGHQQSHRILASFKVTTVQRPSVVSAHSISLSISKKTYLIMQPISLPVIADSDNNSSIPSSPWQRDTYRKSSNPRKCCNNANELTFTFCRPRKLIVSPCDRDKLKHRRPFQENGNVKFTQGSEKSINGGGKKSTKGKLIEMVQKLSEKLSTTSIAAVASSTAPTTPTIASAASSPTSQHSTALNGNSRNVQSSKTYSLANHIASTINSQPHQHVSPRKRILRELEKVSLEDIKCSRPKTINGNNSTSSNSSSTTSPMPPVSRPISSYSITSLLAHKTNNNSSSQHAENGKNASNNNHHHHDHMSDSAASQYEKSSASLSQQHSPSSDSPMHSLSSSHMRTPPSSNGNSVHSPQQNSETTHHAFHKYHPVTRGSPSPSFGGDSLSNHSRTTGNFSPSLNYSIRESSSSPNTEKSSSSNRNTPPSSGRTIRTLPKKTAALRQQFSSPTMDSTPTTPSGKDQPTPMITNEREKTSDVESIYKSSAFVPPHLAYPPQLYSQLNYLSQAMPPFYAPSPFYDPAMMAVAAAAYRFPHGVQPGIPIGYPGSIWPLGQFPPGPLNHPAAMQSAEQRHSPSSLQFKASYVPNSPWNPNLTSNHPLIEKNSIEKSENETNSGAYL